MGRCTKAEFDYRCHRVARMMAQGATRSDVTQYAASEWGKKQRAVDVYIARAREILKEDWAQEREDYVATLLTQLNYVHKKGLETNQLAVVLGALNTAAKLAKVLE